MNGINQIKRKAKNIIKNIFDNTIIEQIKKIRVHDHLCLIYENEEQQFNSAIPFIKAGFENSEKCVYITDDDNTLKIIEKMEIGGIPTKYKIAKGDLLVITKKEAYNNKDYFDPYKILNFFSKIANNAKEDGYLALRITEEMSCPPGNEIKKKNYWNLKQNITIISRFMILSQCVNTIKSAFHLKSY